MKWSLRKTNYPVIIGKMNLIFSIKKCFEVENWHECICKDREIRLWMFKRSNISILPWCQTNNLKFNFPSRLYRIVWEWRMCTMKNDSNQEVIYRCVVIYLYFNYFTLVHSLFWHLPDLTAILIISVNDNYMYCHCREVGWRDFESNFVFSRRVVSHCSLQPGNTM